MTTTVWFPVRGSAVTRTEAAGAGPPSAAVTQNRPLAPVLWNTAKLPRVSTNCHLGAVTAPCSGPASRRTPEPAVVTEAESTVSGQDEPLATTIPTAAVEPSRATAAVPGPLATGVNGGAGLVPPFALHGQLEQAYRQAPVGTFGGGVNEVQREIVATVGLGMPRAPR